MGGLREEAADGIGERECGTGSGRGDGNEMGSVTEEEGKRRGPVSISNSTGTSGITMGATTTISYRSASNKSCSMQHPTNRWSFTDVRRVRTPGC